MSKKDIAKSFVEGLISEETFTRLIEKENTKQTKKNSTRKKRISKEDRKARSNVLLCILALMQETKWDRKEKTDFDLFLADELCNLSDCSEIRRTRSRLNKLLKKNNMIVQNTFHTSKPIITVTFALKPKYRRVLHRHIIDGGVYYLNISHSHIKQYIISLSDNLTCYEFKQEKIPFKFKD